MKKRTKMALSFMLVVCLMLSGMPVVPTEAISTAEVLAEPMAEVAAVEETDLSLESTSIDPIILQENTDLRKEYEKHFLMSDGSYQVMLYNEPIHKLENGEWKEIDNTLALRTAQDGAARYATADGLTDVSFSQSFGEQLVTMQQDGYSLSWDVQAVSDSSSVKLSTETLQPALAEPVSTDLSAFSAEEQKTLVVKASSTIQYRNALRQDVDLEYIVLPSKVKENIILQSAQDISYYVVTVYTENLSARLLANREIQFYNSSDEVIFTMTSPYMYDSAGELSEEIAVEMVSKGSGCYFIKMTPDAQWLDDESRVYPVVIDPQVSVDTTRTNIIDNYVLEGAGVQNRNLDRLYIGTKSGSTARAYIKYATMPTLPASSTITAATMTLYITSGTSTGYTASAYKVTGGDWASGTITWDNMPAASTLLASNISHNSLTKYQFSCKTAVQGWYSGSTTGSNANYGVMIRYYNESIADYNAFYSADHTEESQRPAMTITYQPPSSSIAVDEGSTYTLTAPSVSGTISWASSNTAVATVNSSGKVTGVKAGMVTISASVSGVVQKTYTVYVTVVDGVYYIKTTAGLCIGTTGRVAENTGISLYARTTSTNNQLRQLWKVTYLDNGCYSIRPMYRLNMALHNSSGKVDIVSVGTSDTLSEIPQMSRWGIRYDSSGYVFTCTNSDSMAMKTDASYAGATVSTASYTSSATNFRWTLEKKTGLGNSVILINTSTGSILTEAVRFVASGESATLDDYKLTASFVSPYSNEQELSWSTTKTSVVSVNKSTGSITGLQAGKRAPIFVKARLYGVEYSASYDVILPEFTLYSIANSGHDHLSSLEYVESSLDDQGFSDNTLNHGIIYPDVCKDDLTICNVFTSRSHGVCVLDYYDNTISTGIQLNDGPEGDEFYFFSNTYQYMSDRSVAIEESDTFANLDVALFIACQTASGGAGGNNLPTEIVNHGAKVAIGFSENILCNEANEWTEAFYDWFLRGYSVQASVEYAEGVVTADSGLDSVVIFGDGSITIYDLALTS